jgi:hypothetical protein
VSILGIGGKKVAAKGMGSKKRKTPGEIRARPAPPFSRDARDEP